ncbi:MAG: hypothetical protein Q9200_003022 [Gallowayella weberi]
MQDKRSAGPCSSTMTKDQLEQPPSAQVSAASADNLHDVPASTNRILKRDSAHPPRPDDFLASSRIIPVGPSTSQYPANFLELPPSTLSNVEHSAGQSDLIDRYRDQDAALRRLNGQDPPSRQRPKASEIGSAASTQPVLVREYSQGSSVSNSPRQSKMKPTKRSSGYRSSELPPLESFSFQDILASIESDVQVSIDKIAEICGRSKMSMADEYSSHMPPQSDFSVPNLQDYGDHVVISRLDPVEEASSTHEDIVENVRSAHSRVTRLSLAGAATNQGDLQSVPVTATSIVASHSQPSAAETSAGGSANRNSYIPQLLAWLRTSRGNDSGSSQPPSRDSGAANALQRILGSHQETTTR